MLQLNYFFIHKNVMRFKSRHWTWTRTLCIKHALAEGNLKDCLLPEKKAQWTHICRNDCRDDFIADAEKNFLPLFCCNIHKQHNK